MQLLTHRLSAAPAGCRSGPVVILGKMLTPLLILEQTQGGTCTITSISNLNSLMMLKMINCWYCSQEPHVRTSLWVGINEANNSPNGAATSPAIARLE
jgi:hypothetical protein